MAQSIQRDLSFGNVALGVANAGFFLGAACASMILGRSTDRVGPVRSLRVASLASGSILLAIAFGARSWASLTVLLVFAGVANSLAQPAANLLIFQGTKVHRHGFGFAVKQSAPPAALMIGGLAVPLVSETVGWRWAFAGAGVLMILAREIVPILYRSEPAQNGDGANGDVASRRAVRALAVTGVFGGSAVGCLTAFFVISVTDTGITEAHAGLLLTVGSAIGLAARLLLGFRSDRRAGTGLPLIAFLLAAGGVGYLLFAVRIPLTQIAAIPIVFGLGWAWAGLFQLASLRASPGAPASASGVVQTGVYIGSIVGPLVFGYVSEISNFSLAWVLVCIWSLIAAVCAKVAQRDLVGTPRSIGS